MAKKLNEKMPPSKKIHKPSGPKVSGMDFSSILEEYDRKMGNKSNYPARAPADISQALERSREGYSDKPRVKQQKKY